MAAACGSAGAGGDSLAVENALAVTALVVDCELPPFPLLEAASAAPPPPPLPPPAQLPHHVILALAAAEGWDGAIKPEPGDSATAALLARKPPPAAAPTEPTLHTLLLCVLSSCAPAHARKASAL